MVVEVRLLPTVCLYMLNKLLITDQNIFAMTRKTILIVVGRQYLRGKHVLTAGIIFPDFYFLGESMAVKFAYLVSC